MLLFSFYATNAIIIGYLPFYLQYKGLNGTEIGWVLAIGPLASIFSQPFWGFMSDKYKTVKRIIVAPMIAQAERVIDDKGGVVFNAWRPHPMFTRLDIKFLDDPKNI